MKTRAIWLAAGVAAIAVVAVLVVILAGGSGSDLTATRSPSQGERDHAAPISLTTLEGEHVKLPAARPGVLFFTVSSCLSCVPSGQALGELKTELGNRADAIWIGIDPGDPPAAVRERRRAMGNPPYPFAIDRSGTLANRYRVQALGTTVVYNSAGEIIARLIEPSKDQLRAALARAGVS